MLATGYLMSNLLRSLMKYISEPLTVSPWLNVNPRALTPPYFWGVYMWAEVNPSRQKTLSAYLKAITMPASWAPKELLIMPQLESKIRPGTMQSGSKEISNAGYPFHPSNLFMSSIKSNLSWRLQHSSNHYFHKRLNKGRLVEHGSILAATTNSKAIIDIYHLLPKTTHSTFPSPLASTSSSFGYVSNSWLKPLSQRMWALCWVYPDWTTGCSLSLPTLPEASKHQNILKWIPWTLDRVLSVTIIQKWS